MKRMKKINPYQQLINRIHGETKMRGWILADTAKAIGISHIYMTSMLCAHHWNSLTRQFFRLHQTRPVNMTLGVFQDNISASTR